MSAKVAVVIVNWNGRKLLVECLPSVLAQGYPDFEVVVVDNGSSDGSAEFVEGSYPAVKLVRNRANLGFAAANNQGLAATSGEYVATLNNDALPTPQWLGELVRVAEAEERIGMCASKMLFRSRPELIDSAGIAPDLAGIAWNRLSGEEDREEPGPYEVFGPCAGAALYRRKMLEEVGGFDEAFFAYLEDVDLAWRARLRGWKCLYVPSAVAYHIHSATMGRGSPLKGYFLGRNKLWVILKDYPAPELLCFLPLILLYDLLTVSYHLVARRDVQPLLGRLAALRGLPRVLWERRYIQGRKKVPFRDLRKLMMPLANPWDALTRARRLEEILSAT